MARQTHPHGASTTATGRFKDIMPRMQHLPLQPPACDPYGYDAVRRRLLPNLQAGRLGGRPSSWLFTHMGDAFWDTATAQRMLDYELSQLSVKLLVSPEFGRPLGR